MNKNSFLIYLDYEEQFDLLSDEEIGILMRAIIKYEKTKEIPQLEGMAKMAFSFIKTQLDRDREKYNKKCEKNKENGARGGRPKKENEKPNGFEKSEGLFQEPKKPDNEDEEDNDNEEDNDEDVVVKQQLLQKRFIECTGSTNLYAITECLTYLDDLPYEVIEIALKKTSEKNGRLEVC